jgi:hypothetical protein
MIYYHIDKIAKEVILMKLIVSEEELNLLQSYGIRNFEQLRIVVATTHNDQLAHIYAKSIAVLAGL